MLELTEIRTAGLGDIAFIFATWLRGLYYGNDWFEAIPKDIFMENYHRVVEALLEKPSVEIRISCLKEDPSTILGYAIIERDRNAIHWIFVKEAWRRFGIAKSLIPEDQKWVMATHLTKLGKRLKPREMIFNPFF